MKVYQNSRDSFWVITICMNLFQKILSRAAAYGAAAVSPAYLIGQIVKPFKFLYKFGKQNKELVINKCIIVDICKYKTS